MGHALLIGSSHHFEVSLGSLGSRHKWIMSAWMLFIHVIQVLSFGRLSWSVAVFVMLLSSHLYRTFIFLFGVGRYRDFS